jgi:hypothetical protein
MFNVARAWLLLYENTEIEMSKNIYIILKILRFFKIKVVLELFNSSLSLHDIFIKMSLVWLQQNYIA